jgi:hypothetical protein
MATFAGEANPRTTLNLVNYYREHSEQWAVVSSEQSHQNFCVVDTRAFKPRISLVGSVLPFEPRTMTAAASSQDCDKQYV